MKSFCAMSTTPRGVALSSCAPRPGVHVPALDGVRGLAAALIFLYHYGGGAKSPHFVLHCFGRALQLGWAGVSLFFALSGFLITGILWDSFGTAHWWRRFYIRRSLRIFPLYYTALLGAILAAAMVGASRSSLVAAWPYFLYLQDLPYFVKTGAISPWLTLLHFWSLAVEEQFYLVWPFLLLLAASRGRGKQLCAIVFGLSLLFRVSIFAFGFDPTLDDGFLISRVGELASGAWLALSMRGPERERNRILRGAVPVLLASSACLLGLVLLTGETLITQPWVGTLGIALFSVAFTALIAACLRSGSIQSLFATPALRWLGKISYGIYVYHLLLRPYFIWAVHKAFPAFKGDAFLVALAAIALPGTLVVATISFVTLESAFLKLKDRLAAPVRQLELPVPS